MTYGITDDGFIIKPFSIIRAEIEEYQAQHIDPSLDFSDQSALSQVNISHASQLAELWELAQAVYANQYSESATGFSLQQLAALTGTVQNAWTYTTVEGQVTLNPNKNLPAGSVAHLQGRPSDRFLTTVEVPSSPLGGTFAVPFIAESPGTIDVTPGLLNTIAEPVSGWTAVTNLVAGIPGSEPESDDELRNKRERELSAAGAANLDAIRADVSSVASVLDVRAEENVKEYWLNGMKPKSVRITVRGGADADIARAIYDSKSGGIDTNGNVTVVVDDSEGNPHDIKFRRAVSRPVYAHYDLEMADGYTADDLEAVKTACVAYLNSLAIGERVQHDRALCAAYSVEKVIAVDSLLIGFSYPPAGTGDLIVGEDEYAEGDILNTEAVAV